AANRAGHAEDQEFRPQVPERDQGDPRQHGAVARDEDRQLAPDARTLEGPAERELGPRSRTMRHLNAARKSGRTTSHRRAMFRNLAANLIAHERIETTDEKAKELRRVTERLITKAIRLGDVAYTKNEDLKPADRAKRLHAQRLVGAFIPRF